MSGVANSIVMDNTILVKTSSLKYLGVIMLETKYLRALV